MARPLRFRCSQNKWTIHRVEESILAPLDENIGARMQDSWFEPPPPFEARRFEMENGDMALFAWGSEMAYWIGNTETPSALWRTEKQGFDEIPYPIARWAQRELLAQLYDEEPWLEPYPHVAWFFLPVFLSKDGRETSRTFFHDHAAGFPDASPNSGLKFLEETLKPGMLDDHRYDMAGKLGTSEALDLGRMRAAMGEFTAARLLIEAGYSIEPEIEVTTGHFLDFRADPPGVLVEVTRPRPPHRREANSPVTAVRETAGTKTTGQLANHGGGAVLLIDCSSYSQSAWSKIRETPPRIDHRPVVLYRARPDGTFDGFELGSVPLALGL